MNPWYVAGAGLVGAWLIMRPKKSVMSANVTQAPAPAMGTAWRINSTPAQSSAPVIKSPSTNAGAYVDHLKQVSGMVCDLHVAADRGVDTAPLDAAMEAPLDVLTAQKDLNVLGATPALTEDGVMGPKTTQALKDFQTATNISVTGLLDGPTSAGIRYAVGKHVLGDGANA
jgi:hypothetical protein